MALNRNKKSLALDLKSEPGLEILKRLVSRADVFVQSLRAGVIEELGARFRRRLAAEPAPGLLLGHRVRDQRPRSPRCRATIRSCRRTRA